MQRGAFQTRIIKFNAVVVFHMKRAAVLVLI